MLIELGVVKQRDQRHDLNVGAIDLGHAKAVLQHPGPMEHTVVRPDRQLVGQKDDGRDGGHVMQAMSLPA